MLLKIKDLNNQVFDIEIDEQKTVSILKNEIENKLKIDKRYQRLLFQGSPLIDEKIIRDCNIRENSIIFLIRTLQYD